MRSCPLSIAWTERGLAEPETRVQIPEGALIIGLNAYTTNTSLSFVPAPANATLSHATAVIGSNLTAGINTTQNLMRAGVNSIAGKIG